MAMVLRAGELLPVKIADLVFYLAPIPRAQKIKLYSECTTRSGGEEQLDSKKLSENLIKASVKRVDGIVDMFEEPIDMELKDGMLTQESYDVLWQLSCVDKVVTASQLCFSGDLASIKGIDGVEVVIPKRKGPRKKKASKKK